MVMAGAGVYPFEGIGSDLPYLPLAARRVLDRLGRKLSLDGWLSLPVDARQRIVSAGSAEHVDSQVASLVGSLIDRATPPPSPTQALPEPDASCPPPELAAALGATRPLDDSRWRSLSALDRYALFKCVTKPEKLAAAYDEILPASRMHPPHLSHLTGTGQAHMVDVGEKMETSRRAVASARVRTTRGVVEAIALGETTKGDVVAVARVAGIMAAKRTAELVPLCHPVRTTRAAIEFEADAERGELRIRATIEAIDRTGVEMEAMLAASVSSLTVYDMIKSADRWATIDDVRLESKSGGKSGDIKRPPERGGA
jgi:cyclic pyranopterin monophosphate synthase